MTAPDVVSDTTSGRPNATPLRFPFRLAAIDIDDTLLGPDGAVGAPNRAAVAALRDRGVRVVLASGRSHANMLPFHQALALGPGPIVSAQGAVVRDAESDEVWLTVPIPPELVADLTRDGFARGSAVLHYALDAVYVQTRTRWTEWDQSRNAQPQVLVGDLLAEGRGDVVKVIWLGDPADVAPAAAEATARYAGQLVITPTDPAYLEFTRAGVDKGTALAVVAARLGVGRDAVVAFGDGNNDAPMLAWAGLGVAMGHARLAARAAADVIVPDGDPGTALARAVEALCLAPGRG